jgi:hypothetical protein
MIFVGRMSDRGLLRSLFFLNMFLNEKFGTEGHTGRGILLQTLHRIHMLATAHAGSRPYEMIFFKFT